MEEAVAARVLRERKGTAAIKPDKGTTEERDLRKQVPPEAGQDREFSPGTQKRNAAPKALAFSLVNTCWNTPSPTHTHTQQNNESVLFSGYCI